MQCSIVKFIPIHCIQVKHMDEVFEAFISARNVDPSELGFEDNFSKEEVSGGISNHVL